jgi:hypothetical protein
MRSTHARANLDPQVASTRLRHASCPVPMTYQHALVDLIVNVLNVEIT